MRKIMSKVYVVFASSLVELFRDPLRGICVAAVGSPSILFPIFIFGYGDRLHVIPPRMSI